MYHNSGAIVKGLATVIVALMMLAVIVGGVFFIVQTEKFGLGALIIVGGCLAAWLSGLMLAAFGELVQNSYKILKVLNEMKANSAVPQPRVEYVETPANNGYNGYNGYNGNYSNMDPYSNSATNVYGTPGNDMGNNATTAVPAANPDVCPNCGSPRKNNSAFCGYCGTRL